jgi:peroxiredoxin
MKARWIIAAAAAVGLAAVTVPVVDGLRTVATATTEAAEGAGAPPAANVCDAKKKAANLKFTLKDMDGRDVDLSRFKGQVVLLNFWATWCGPCKYEIPAFVELQSKYRDKGFVVLGVSVDDPVDTLKPFVAKYKMNYPVLLGLDREDFVERAWGPMWGIPTSYIIAKDGNVCKKHTGLATKEQIEREIVALLST